MYSLFIGCDISKAYFDVSFKKINGQISYLGRFANNHKGFEKLVSELKRKSEVDLNEWFVCFENTGIYSKALLEWLISNKIKCKEEMALKIYRSSGLKRGKSDKMDSAQITQYVFEKRDSMIPTKMAKPEIIRLKCLLSRRNFLVRQKQACLISVKEALPVLDPDLAELFSQQNQKLIDSYNQLIKEVEQIIEHTISENKALKNNFELIKSVVGVGTIIAAYMITLTDNFTAFDSARQFASYSGVAPFPNQSGKKTGKTRISHMANKKMKSLLSNGAISAINYDKQIKTYYAKKSLEGKPKGVIINAVKNKLIQRIFAVVKRQTPYVQLNTYV